MWKLFRNRELKNTLVIITVLLIVFSFSSTLVIKHILNVASSRYAEQNISIVGAVVSKYPDAENEIASIVIKGNNEYYITGSNVMDKYGYYKDLNYDANYLFKESYSDFKIYWFILLLTFSILVLLTIIINISPIYKNLKVLGKMSDDLVEGNVKGDIISFKEGEISIFYEKFIDMAERLNRALNDLKDEKVSLKDIINDISHQLKTPLTALVSYNDILKKHNSMEKEDIDLFINYSSDQLDRMQWLITTLLKYARIESDAVDYNKIEYPLSKTIDGAIEPLKIKAEEKNQSIMVEYDGSGIYNHDTKWIGEALSNIIKNAIEHTGKNGKINIRLEETPLSVSIIIEDNGEGISRNELKNIFRRFYKGQNSLNPTSIGIGLSLSKKIIEAHNGSITVESEVGVGTIFHITFLKYVI